MVKKQQKKSKERRPDVIQPKSWTGYPEKKTNGRPLTVLEKAAGGGKSAS